MAGSQYSGQGKVVHDPVMAVIEPALKVGVACGAAGYVFGGTSGILKSTTPFLFATASGLQTFTLGTSFWATRGFILQAWKGADTSLKPRDLSKASALAGGLSGGMVALLLRGRASVLPATFIWSIFGLVGQVGVNAWNVSKEQPREDFWTRMARKSWSPMKVITDEEYADVLRERLLKVDAEIGVLDDKIAALREQQGAEGGQADVADTAAK